MFNVGDKVRVTQGPSNSSKSLHGRIGIVTEAFCSHVTLDIERELPTGGGGLWNDELELIAPANSDLLIKAKSNCGSFKESAV